MSGIDEANPVGRDVAGLTNAVVRSLERSAIRMRGSGATQSAWRMEIDSDAGKGAIILIDLPSGEAVYRGDGTFLGWSQQQLAAAYQGLRTEPDEPQFEVHQLG